MSHLTLKTLARIADGPATADEAAHVASCRECRAEIEALRAQAAMLRELPPPRVPQAIWRTIEARLGTQREGPGTARRWPRVWLPRAAAAAAIFAAGTLAGARLDRETPDLARSGSEPIVERAATTVPPDQALREAEALYAAALARYMTEHRETDAALDPMRRLAALESIILTARAALVETPQDPVIGGYYRTALAQREALLSQVQLAEREVWF